MRGFLKFMRGLLRLPIPVQLWLLVLVAANLLAPLFFLDRLEARVVILAFLAAGMFMGILTAVAGFTRLLGLGHSPWIGLIPYLWTRLDQIPVDDFFGVWVRSVMVPNGISLVLDVADVTRYLRGDRSELVDGL
ncbi:MAG: hypothetical protein GTN62_10785 [Gemmatimonadales bacterium]|nr:hypothetical protein [Gemmatimonadales bacterium]NIN12159.1 hypothetical protein [Gemmatimonadales bacterium]NIN50580.1 hypothetical protein [Gemmatimonadales bacterium]NIP08044.1 hypothetical protein [Gemmatimonadales bacterium]NIR00626.1 hypothetical protein [Gemmatimonadales bacterium]